jgi:acyl-coenzyme A synthetase/AMP-(fatty) acid ligase
MTEIKLNPEAVEAAQHDFTKWCIDHSGDVDILRGGLTVAIRAFLAAEEAEEERWGKPLSGYESRLVTRWRPVEPTP